MKKIVGCILIMTLIVVGCQKEGVVTITPSKLFDGDAQKLAPHFDMTTGCVKVKYKGDKESFGLQYEIWENGELKDSGNAASTYLDKNTFDGEIGISIKRNIDKDDKEDTLSLNTIIYQDTGYIGSSTPIQSYGKDYGHGPVEIYNELSVSDDTKATIWGMTAYKDSYVTNGSNIEERVKEAEWGLLLRLSFN